MSYLYLLSIRLQSGPVPPLTSSSLSPFGFLQKWPSKVSDDKFRSTLACLLLVRARFRVCEGTKRSRLQLRDQQRFGEPERAAPAFPADTKMMLARDRERECSFCLLSKLNMLPHLALYLAAASVAVDR